MDKLFHCIAFGSFTFAFILAFPKYSYRLIILFSMALGIFVEVIQSFLPYRSFSFLDMLADLIGILLSALLLKWLR
jgi:VanZ family protein